MERKIVFVCSGNICRSPMADAIARRDLTDHGATDVHVESAGTLRIEGRPADPHAITALAKIGIDFREHRSQGVYPRVVSDADAILVMSPHHVDGVLEVDPSCRSRIVELWRHADVTDLYTEIEDPVGQDLATFIDCRELIEECLDNWLPRFLAGESPA